jgi:co-chaperonin GroES (HSP10)
VQEIDLKSAIETNVLKLGALTMEAFNDRLLVIEDEFRSGYECTVCLGKTKVPCAKCGAKGYAVCDNCRGSGHSILVPGAKCTVCLGVGKLVCEGCNGAKTTACEACGGRGVTEGGLVIPEASERRPTTGVVVSTGWKVNSRIARFLAWFTRKQIIQRGQSVIYTSFSGHVYDLELPNDEVVVIRVIQETDILSIVSGHLELRRVKKTQALGSAA